MTDYRLNGQDSIPGKGKIVLFSRASSRLEGPTSLLSNGQRISFSAGIAAGGVTLTIHPTQCRGQE
jgi:hypothetical protein